MDCLLGSFRITKKEYLEANFAKDVSLRTLADLAEAFQLSRFSRGFKASTEALLSLTPLGS